MSWESSLNLEEAMRNLFKNLPEGLLGTYVKTNILEFSKALRHVYQVDEHNAHNNTHEDK